MSNRMILNEKAWFGCGSIQQIVTEIKQAGYKKGLIVTDHPLLTLNIATQITKLLDQAGLAYTIFADISPNPTIAMVKAGVAACQAAQADYLIAIGGGSPQDTCKAIGIIMTNPKFSDVRSLEGVANTRNPSLPIIAIPTTAGTASEVTINYVITDEEKQRKFVCVDPHDIPKIAIVDTNLMLSMPASLKATTGIDALTHAIEGFITLGAWLGNE